MNTLALLPFSAAFERRMGTLQLCHLVTLLSVSGGLFYVGFAYIASIIWSDEVYVTVVGFSLVWFGWLVIDSIEGILTGGVERDQRYK